MDASALLAAQDVAKLLAADLADAASGAAAAAAAATAAPEELPAIAPSHTEAADADAAAASLTLSHRAAEHRAVPNGRASTHLASSIRQHVPSLPSSAQPVAQGSSSLPLATSGEDAMQQIPDADEEAVPEHVADALIAELNQGLSGVAVGSDGIEEQTKVDPAAVAASATGQ